MEILILAVTAIAITLGLGFMVIFAIVVIVIVINPARNAEIVGDVARMAVGGLNSALRGIIDLPGSLLGFIKRNFLDDEAEEDSEHNRPAGHRGDEES